MTLKETLSKIITGEVFDDVQTQSHYSTDASIFQVTPHIVAFPQSAEDIGHIVKYVSLHKETSPALSITARAAGTCMSGGSLNESIILDVTKHMNTIGEVINEQIIVQPGVFYRDMEKVTLASGLLMPSYTASKDLCAVGGMVANNAGGEKSLTYGSTESWVRRLKVILSDGNEYIIEPLSGEKLQTKLAQQNFEGELYRKIYNLVVHNFGKLLTAKPTVTKNTAGYFLWNVWDGHTFDLTKLFTGSQGTLGIITEITFALVPVKTHKRLLIITLDNLDTLGAIVQKVLEFKPNCFETYDDHTFELAEKYMPECADCVITEKTNMLTLIAEFDSDDGDEALSQAQRAHAALAGMPLNTALVATEEEAENYWKIRRASFKLLREHVEGSHRAAPYIDDFIVDPNKLVDFLPRLRALMSEYKLTYTLAGHIGNGNFHLVPLVDMTKEMERARVIGLADRVFTLVFEFGGSMAGEHNDGIIRTPFLPQMYGEEICTLFKETKNIFDPKNIFNPGKKVDGTLEYAMLHLCKTNACAHF